MFINPRISKQLADEHRRDLTADDQRERITRQFGAGSGTAVRREPLTNRLWRRLRPVTRPRRAATLNSLTKVREWITT